VEIQIARSLRHRDTPILHQPHRLKLELAAELPSSHSLSPVPSNTLSRCPRNRQQANRLSPIHATKQGKRYRCYVSSRLKDGRTNRNDGWRIPAPEIEAIVLQQLQALLADEAMLSTWMHEAGYLHCIEAGLAKARKGCGLLAEGTEPNRLREVISRLLQRIDLAKNAIKLTASRSAIVAWLIDTASSHPDARDRIASATAVPTDTDPASDDAAVDATDDLHVIDQPLVIKQRGVERRLVIDGPYTSRYRPDQTLIDLIARAHVYLDALTAGRERQEISNSYGVHPEDVSRLLPLAFLSPRLLEAILTGQQPADLTARYLTRDIELPIIWAAQHQMLGV
jgi:hypothetical protein